MPEPPVEDILARIVEDRRRDMVRLGPTLGSPLPNKRLRPVIPFLAEPGVILEIKRASPSKGAIAPDLDPAVMAHAYARAGARNVSVLTERNYFRGSLGDLLSASAAEPGLAFLRKDFLLNVDEVEVSFRAGADAVLLIARVLTEDELLAMARAARELGLLPFVEVREAADLPKLRAAAAEGRVLAGVNARDLATFETDPLIPAALRSRLPSPAVFESGVRSPEDAALGRRLGFQGVLVGEAAARNPERTFGIVNAFLEARPDGAGFFWRAAAERREALSGRALGRVQPESEPVLRDSKTEGMKPARPLVKICGLTRLPDALAAVDLGADLLGFVFAESPRAAMEDVVLAVARSLGGNPSGRAREGGALEAPGFYRPLLVAVVTELESERARTALRLARKGYIDAIQYHGARGIEDLARLDALLSETEAGHAGGAGRFAAIGVAEAADVDTVEALARRGEPRVLVDARVAGRSGGTGVRVEDDLVDRVRSLGPLWLAGGLGVGAIGGAIERYRPELVDASSRLESEPGHKDAGLLRAFFKEIEDHVG